MTETELREALQELINESVFDSGRFGDEVTDYVETPSFEDAGILTMNEGIVLRVGDSEFQLTIVRSR